MAKNFRMLGSSASLVLLAMMTVPCVMAQGSAAAVAQEPITAFAFGQDSVVALTALPREMSEVPQHVWHAASAAVGNIKATRSGVEVAADGTMTYVLDFQSERGRKVSVDVASTGKILAVEFALTVQELPAQVSATMRRWAPNLKASEIEKSVRPDAVVYEFVGKDAQGNDFYAEIPEDGRGIVIVPNQATMVTPGK